MATSVLEHHGTAAAEKSGLWSWITTVDHKRIGILYGVSAFAFFLIGGLEALLIRIQLGSPENTFLSPEAYNQLFTMHGTTMIFLGVMPLSAMFFNYMVPLQIGARDVAFPAAQRVRYWVFILGGLLLNASFLFRSAPNAGWFGYANLTTRQYLAGDERRFLDRRPAGPRDRVAGRSGELLRHHRQHARTRHEVHAHADVRLDELHYPDPAAARLPRDHRRADRADVRPDASSPPTSPAPARPAAGIRCSGSTCSGSSGIRRSTS